MSAPSRLTLRLLADELAGNWDLRSIADLFEEEGVQLGEIPADSNPGGQRRTLMAQYVSTLDMGHPDDLAKLYRVLNRVMAGVTSHDTEPGGWLDRLERSLRQDGIAVDGATHQIVSAVTHLMEQSLASLPDATVIREHLNRLGGSVDTDPRLAVSVAKDLVESTAKLVLRARDVIYTEAEDLPALVSRAQEALGLSAAKVATDNPEVKQLKTILGGLVSLTRGITELRNKVGVGHGRESVPTWVRPRHARLAAGAAQVWCQLMLETLDDPQAPWRRTV